MLGNKRLNTVWRQSYESFEADGNFKKKPEEDDPEQQT